MEKKKLSQKTTKQSLQKQQTQKFKSQYFDQYDDIKSHTHKVIDW